jgi:hypothetical protein
MNKETLIEKLLTEKAENNNTIDLNAYALGLDAMYEALVLYDVVGRSEQLICPECENPYPHLHTDGSYSCEDCGHKWAN